ncbi:MAG TPA: FkbM family methyltransferase [Gemmatimonadaceae bacterium]|nr:FkbM family methyltransferase [Gemmatimonadaceae bacterium]
MSISTIAKTSLSRLARTLGYEIVSVSRVMPRDIASHLRSVFETLDITCVLDVGANVGQYRTLLRDEVGYEKLIVSFEPARHAVQALRDQSRTDARWVIYPCALGARNDVRSLNVMRADTLSSFLAPDNSVTDLFAGHNSVDHTEAVDVRTLDSVMDELRTGRDIGTGIFLKMDTQGYDLQVLAGAQQSLAGIAAVQTELSCLSLYKEMPSYVSVLSVLDAKGFQLSGMFPVNQDSALRVIEADCVMINGARVAGKPLRLMWTNAP